MAKLKSCCKLNMYNVRICGTKTPLEGFSDTFVCVKKEEMRKRRGRVALDIKI